MEGRVGNWRSGYWLDFQFPYSDRVCCRGKLEEFNNVYSLGTIFLALALGWLGDRWNKPLLSGLGLLPVVIGMTGFNFQLVEFLPVSVPPWLAVAMATIPLNWAQIGDYFGRKSYAVCGGHGRKRGLAAFISPIFAGWIFDRTGSYVIVFLSFSAILSPPSSSPSSICAFAFRLL